MHLRQVKHRLYLLFIFISDKLIGHACVVQEGEFVGPYRHALRLAGIIIQVVIGTQVIFCQQLVNHAAAFATEVFFLERYFIGNAGFAAVIAKGGLKGGLFCLSHKTPVKMR